MDLLLAEIPPISKSELQKLLIMGTHLHQWQGQGKRDIPAVMQKQGFFQLDPLNPAGRSHDLFFASRIKNYHRGEAENNLYHKKLGFESYFHNLNFISRDFFPLFYSPKNRQSLHRYYLTRLDKVEQTAPNMITQIKAFIADHGPTTSKDLQQFGSVATEQNRWTTGSSANILEVLWAMGELAVVKRDEQFHKHYDLIEKYFPKGLLKKLDISDSELWQQRITLMLHSFPVLDSKIGIGKNGNLRKPRGKRAWLKLMEVPLPNLIENNPKGALSDYNPTLVYCAPMKKIYIVPSKWQDFMDLELDGEMRGISPLDPLIWDRNLTHKVFGFEYLWEIYKPKKDRRWGYYHYPLLYQGKFIGRIEAKIPKKTTTLQFSNFYPEKGIKYTPFLKTDFNTLVKRWKLMVGASDTSFDLSCKKLT
ncbi:MAG: DNA glycosylase AlkZ-like family protein [Promethearchaeota archaeon]